MKNICQAVPGNDVLFLAIKSKLCRNPQLKIKNARLVGNFCGNLLWQLVFNNSIGGCKKAAK